MAERAGFEPAIPLRVCRISSAVLSTTQPPLRRVPALASRLVAWAAATCKQSQGCARGSNCQVAPASPPAPGTFHAVFLPTIAATL
jgi:hypothetical protein